MALYSKSSAIAEIVSYLNDVESEIIDAAISKNMVASGKTLASLEVVPSSTGAGLYAANHIIFLETGRGPTSPTGPYQASDKTLLQIITEWITDKGLDLNPYAVTKTIHTKGTKLYRQGGQSGVLSVPLAMAGLSDLFFQIATQFEQNSIAEILEPIREIEAQNKRKLQTA